MQSENILLWFDPKIASLKDLSVYDDRLKHPLLEFSSSTNLQTQTETAHQCFEFILLRNRVSICEPCLQGMIGIDPVASHFSWELATSQAVKFMLERK